MRSLLELGVFDLSNTKVFTEAGARGGVHVIFEVREPPVIVEVRFEGLRNVTKEELLTELCQHKIKDIMEVPNNSYSKVSLREITKETVREITRLKVSPEQERFVASNAESIAEAYFSPDTAWFRAIYAGETPVGFLMLEDNAAAKEYSLWRFMIDARYIRRKASGKKHWNCYSIT